MTRPNSTRDLQPAEQRFLEAMSQLGFGRFEFLRIDRGQLILDPWPPTVKDVKFGTSNIVTRELSTSFELKRQVVELFEYIRSVEAGEIRTLTIRHGLPFAMSVEHRPGKQNGGQSDA